MKMRFKKLTHINKREQAEKISNIFASRLPMNEEQKDDYTFKVFLSYEAMKTTPNETDFLVMMDACNTTVFYLFSHMKDIYKRFIGMKCLDAFEYLLSLGYRGITDKVNAVQPMMMEVMKRGLEEDRWTMSGELMRQLKPVLEMFVHASRIMPKRMLRLSSAYLENLRKSTQLPFLTITDTSEFVER